jgi:4-amino-4-deoxy-L-arabinose transferase-like glycosyltransferase
MWRGQPKIESFCLLSSGRRGTLDAMPSRARRIAGAVIGHPPWARPALVVIAAVAAISYGHAANDEVLEIYYAAAVRSMSLDGHNFLYGAFDPNATISLDKLPGALWLQAISVHLFGLHTWAIVLPQVIEGTLAVIVLYLAVRLVAGPLAALVAAAVLAATPVVVALDRGNISDTLMVLLLVLAAHAVTKAIVTGHGWRWLLLAGAWVGLAFQAKMVQAWLVLPAIALAYLVFTAPSWWRRFGQVAAMGAVALAVSLSWMTFVSLHPADQRPYADGSQDDSVFEQVFVYNALGRVGSNQVESSSGLGGLAFTADPRAFLHAFTADAPAGPTRLLSDRQGRDIGWLLPASAVAAAWVLVDTRRRPRADPLRAAVVLWTGWLATFTVALSVASYINPYYGAVLAPAVAALMGVAIGRLWERRAELTTATWLAVGGVVAGSAAYAAWLLTGGFDVSGWATVAVLGVAGLAAVLVVAAARFRQPALAGVAIAVVLIALLAAPTMASAQLAASGRSPFDTPFQDPAVTFQLEVLPARALDQGKAGLDTLAKLRQGATYLFASDGSIVAAPAVYSSGEEVLPIGGFSGQAPVPTIDDLRRDVDSGALHFVLLPPAAPHEDARLQWIRSTCVALPPTPDANNLASATQSAVLTVYLCAPKR